MSDRSSEAQRQENERERQAAERDRERTIREHNLDEKANPISREIDRAEQAGIRREDRDEAEARALDVEKRARRNRWELVAFAAGLLMLVGYGGHKLDSAVDDLGAAQSDFEVALVQVDGLVEDINAAAIKNCRDSNRNAKAQRRSILRGIDAARAQAEETKTFDRSLFPDISEAEFDDLLKEQLADIRAENKKRRHDYRELDPVKCLERFPST